MRGSGPGPRQDFHLLTYLRLASRTSLAGDGRVAAQQKRAARGRGRRLIPAKVPSSKLRMQPHMRPSSDECVLPCFALISTESVLSCSASEPENEPGVPPL